MTRPVSDRPQSWSYTFVLASNAVVSNKMLCDMIMLKCNKHLHFSCNKCRNSAKHNWSDVITKMRVATEEFFLLCSLAVD